MAKSNNIDNIVPNLEGNLERDLNRFVREALSDLSTERNSPVDTGFFASSWTAGTQRPRPDEPRESVAPWSNIRPKRDGRQNNSQSRIEPRFINEIPNFKPFSKVFIGNRSQYAARALASPNSQIPQYVQGKLRPLINRIFTDKPKLGIAAFGTGVRGKSKNVRFKGAGIGPFSDPSSVFVDYETP